MKMLPTIDTLQPILYSGVPVITTELLAQLYSTESMRIRQNHHENKGRFTEGKHFFKVVGNDLKSLRVVLNYSQNTISPKTRALILWTERGAARHAKMLETDQAWEVFERLEDCYFNSRESSSPYCPDNPQETIQALHTMPEHLRLLTQPDYRQEVLKEFDRLTGKGSLPLNLGGMVREKVISALLLDLLRNSRALVSFDERLNPQINILPPTGLIVDPFDYDSVLNLTKSHLSTETLQDLIKACADKLAKSVNS